MLLLFDNYALGIEGATVSTSYDGVGDFVVGNLLTPWLDEHYRTGSLAAAPQIVTLRFALNRPRAIDIVYLGRHNIRLGPVRVRFFKQDPVFTSPIYESAWIDPIIRAKMSDFTWPDMPWNLGPREEDLDDWQSRFRLDSLIMADQTYRAVRYVEIDIDGSGGDNFGVDHFQIGYPIIARAFQPIINLVLGWGLNTDDRSEVVRTDAGADTGRQRSIGGKLAFSLKYLERDEAFARIFGQFCKRKGRHGRVFVWVEPEQRRYFYDQRMIATATKLPRVSMDFLEWSGANGWELTETE